MKRLFYLILIIYSSCFINQNAFAQNRQLRYAEKQLEMENFQHAAEVFEQAYKSKPKYTTAKKAAETYQLIQNYEKAFEWWEIVVGSEEAERNDYYNYLVSAIKVGKSDQIDEILNTTSFEEYDFPEIDFDLLKKMSSQKPKVKLVPVEGLNSDGSDFGLHVNQKGLKYFSSDRGDIYSTEKKSIRLDAKNKLYSSEKSSFNDREFFSIYTSDTSGSSTKLTSDLSDALHISDPSLMESKSILFYTVFRDVNKIKGNRNYVIHPEIYFSKVTEEGNLIDSKSFPVNDFVNYGVQNPFVDEQSKRIYFASDKPGGTGGFDLYFVTYDENLNFGEPINLGSNVNTNQNESHPTISGNTLYFSSKGHSGLGGMDIFSAKIKGNGFENVKNLGVPYNSPRDDFGYFVSSEGKRYLSSDRTGGMGLDDIYSIEDLFKRLIARVIDCEDNLVTEDYNVSLNANDDLTMISTNRNEAGELLAELDIEKDFILNISKKGYFSISDSTLSTVGLEEDEVYREYRLSKVPYNLPVLVDIVYYDLDKSKIRNDAVPVLDKIAELMQKYDFLDLAVASHTDSRASDAYNKALSQRRADAVKEYLSKFNIPTNRIRIDWFGKENLTNDCGDGVPCPETKHQLNRRSELVLEAFTDTEKEYEFPRDLIGKDNCDITELMESIQREFNNIPTVYFDFDKSAIRTVHQRDLERVGIMLQKMKNLQLYISGHTDQRGNEDYNLKLAERRAKAVMEYLINKGIDSSRMQYEWFGKSRPINDCGSIPCTEEMHQQNRRTELQLKGGQ
ncbi:Outer membrane protein OmpA [Aquiflexum balticum DSM 16537]|uniref:Outer membrane protein OmpA n=1 Tax=Aquiflexum balticum DSM 16537 TaxID=758820 RepID=A0A1W2GZE3_9BACT|nr:OmpA family protein [Aquiflexum balticum]SMD42080.1 Outer membrane protein OmpA [Aquiflexum balticum DSM 16537]